MDETQEGTLLIATSTVVLVAFTITVLAVMLIYRKRKVQHAQEIALMNEKFTSELLQTQLEVQQQTMQRIGREIHDNVGQQLTLAYLYAQQIHTTDTPLAEKVQGVASLINDSLTDLRNLSRGLVDVHAIQSAGLPELIRLECEKVKTAAHCSIDLSMTPTLKELSPAVKIFVLRIFQEFVQNSIKHSKCTLLTVALTQLEKGIQLVSEDNGKGFSHESSEGVGLTNMKKRAQMIGGTFSLESKQGIGTTMRLFVPTEF
jgi:signal transduction histidine kinase